MDIVIYELLRLELDFQVVVRIHAALKKLETHINFLIHKCVL